ncbi:hypothetical protein LVD17_10380 [Fulvivirga ulvae]|uniref:hypothetical protein n=1 Tax=Fulvivirga ulvae TaxID=2904245 RepID=UPI001F2CC47D|nr:hypothetical protein [Fulvivirga ulvae]UII34216.1 hypothetical protein LVD17_10380 [Fulvivirga ulvae]
MNKSGIQYFVGGLMLLFSFYQIYIKEYWEAAMYISAGLAFITMGLIKREALPKQKTLLNVFSWVFILLAVFLFLFLIRTDG